MSMPQSWKWEEWGSSQEQLDDLDDEQDSNDGIDNLPDLGRDWKEEADDVERQFQYQNRQ